MRKTTETELHFTDCVLTVDREHWCSPSYGGMSSRTELWLMTLLFVLLRLCPGLWVHSESPLLYECLKAAVEVFIFFPLWVRRGRQMGSIAWGLMPVASSSLFSLGMLWFALTGRWEVWEELLGGLPSAISFFVSLPLFFYGGIFAGRKNELHRAAIAGDRKRVERMVSFFPTSPLKLSEKGFTARDYAGQLGHHELAAWLRAQEEVLAAARREP